MIKNINISLTFGCYDCITYRLGGISMFHILVVEDDKDLNRTVCTYLNASGYQATGCLGANEAYDAMYETMFDLIVSDIMMPGIDGFEFVKTVRRAKIASSRKLEVGAFSMDMEEHIALLGGEEINLTHREFNILYKLLSYPKKTFTRQQLMDEFWDVDTDTTPRAVDVYMTKLRSKLADCDDFEIKTVHGLGYKVILK